MANDDPASSPATPTTRRRPWLIAAALVAAGAIAATAIAVVVVANNDEHQIRGTVTDYLAALEAGDAEAALEAFDLGRDPRCPELVTTQVYSTVKDRPTDATITHIAILPDGHPDDTNENPHPSASVHVDYTSGPGGEARSGELTLTRWNDVWELGTGGDLSLMEPNVQIYGEGETTFNGACADVDHARMGWVDAFPGTYEVSYRDPHHVTEAEPMIVSVPSAIPTAVEPRVKPALMEAAAAQVQEWIAACSAAGFTGPTCVGEEVYVPPNFVPNAGENGVQTDMGAGFTPSLGTEGWDYVTSIGVAVNGTYDCTVDPLLGCTQGEPGERNVYFRYKATAVVDDDGALTLTRLVE